MRLGPDHPRQSGAGRAGPGSDEGHDPWASFLGELTDRGLRAPLLVITDGAAGLIGAVEVVFSNSLRQRCLVHRGRNLLAKAPRPRPGRGQGGLLADLGRPRRRARRGRGGPGPPAGHAFADRYHRRSPAAVECLLATLPELTTFLRFPREHWARIRHTNLIERTFGETRRRTKVIGRLPGERSCLSLVWAVLDRASPGWRGVVMTPAAVRLLQELRRQLHHRSRLEEVIEETETVTPAA
ncbi:MAG: transposase [Actinomycetes bacterium]